jgi:hypothetical protein
MVRHPEAEAAEESRLRRRKRLHAGELKTPTKFTICEVRNSGPHAKGVARATNISFPPELGQYGLPSIRNWGKPDGIQEFGTSCTSYRCRKDIYRCGLVHTPISKENWISWVLAALAGELKAQAELGLL